MHQEKYSLKWHTYSDHLKSMMKVMMMDEDFADVTLVTEDKIQIKANINILRACSPVFKDILKKGKTSNQIMYLRGIQFPELESIIQFIYLGEATFYEDRMDEFLAVAKSLEIKELCNTETVPNGKSDDESPPCDPVISTKKLEEKTDISDHMQMEMQSAQERTRRFVARNGKYECDQCNKTYSGRGGLSSHKQSAHQGVKYACDQCDQQFTQQCSLTVHIQSRHEGIKYACDQCDQQFTQQSSLTDHFQSKHEGIKYVCDQCQNTYSHRGKLNTHKQSAHSGVKYACDQCDQQFTVKSSLTDHIQSKHEGIKYVCDQCDQQFSQRCTLSEHIQSKHEGIKYVCDQCDQQFTLRRSVKKHIKNKHNVKLNTLKPRSDLIDDDSGLPTGPLTY